MKSGRFIRVCALAAAVFAAFPALVRAQEAMEAQGQADFSLGNMSFSVGQTMPDGAQWTMSQSAGDVMEALPLFLQPNSPQSTTPTSLLSPAPGGVLTPGIPLEPQASGAGSFSAPPSPGSTGGPPAVSGGSVEDFLTNTQTTQLQNSDSYSQAEQSQAEQKKSGAYFLLKGLLAPLALPAGKTGAATANQAAQMGREDYESHILGTYEPSEDVQNQDAFWAAKPTQLPASHQPVTEKSSDQVMVALSLNVKNDQEDLRDALADLSKEALLKPEPRFSSGVRNPTMNGNISVIGRLPGNKMRELFKNRSIGQIRVDWNPGPSTARNLLAIPGTASRMMVGLRIPAGVDPAAALQSDLPRLSAESGFSYDKTIGYRAIRGSKDVMLMVSGNIPLRDLPAVLADPSVLQISPVPPAPQDSQAQAPLGLLGFFSYTMQHSPGLFVLTALALTLTLAGF